MRRPSIQFYPGDWQRDIALRSVSITARGVWIEMLCLMHQAEPYGHLVLRGQPIATRMLARMIGASEREVTTAIAELEEAGVFTRIDGAIVSRRMIRDEAVRNVRAAGGHAGAEHGKKGAEHGAKGGRPRKETGDKKPPLIDPGRGVLKPPIKPPPSSSSSSSTDGDDDTSSTTTRVNAPVVVVEEPDAGLPEPLDFTGEAQAQPDPVHLRAVELTAIGRKAGAAYHASDPRVRHWAERGVSDGQLLTAIERAQQQRHEAGSAQPINAGYLDAIVHEIAAPPAGARHGNARFDPAASNHRLLRELESGVGAVAVDPPPAQPPFGDVRGPVPLPLRDRRGHG